MDKTQENSGSSDGLETIKLTLNSDGVVSIERKKSEDNHPKPPEQTSLTSPVMENRTSSSEDRKTSDVVADIQDIPEEDFPCENSKEPKDNLVCDEKIKEEERRQLTMEDLLKELFPLPVEPSTEKREQSSLEDILCKLLSPPVKPEETSKEGKDNMATEVKSLLDEIFPSHNIPVERKEGHPSPSDVLTEKLLSSINDPILRGTSELIMNMLNKGFEEKDLGRKSAKENDEVWEKYDNIMKDLERKPYIPRDTDDLYTMYLERYINAHRALYELSLMGSEIVDSRLYSENSIVKKNYFSVAKDMEILAENINRKSFKNFFDICSKIRKEYGSITVFEKLSHSERINFLFPPTSKISGCMSREELFLLLRLLG